MQLIKIAEKSKVKEEKERLERVLKARKAGHLNDSDVEEAKDDYEEELEDEKELKKKAWARIKKLPWNTNIGPNHGIVFRMVRART